MPTIDEMRATLASGGRQPSIDEMRAALSGPTQKQQEHPIDVLNEVSDIGSVDRIAVKNFDLS